MYVYIHIPFCTNICSYCDFCKIIYNTNYIEKYLNSLEKEIQMRYKGELVKSIYIGGGTPSSLNYEELKKLLNLTNLFNLSDEYEFTIECNIENLDKEKIRLFKEYKINRISIGIQSFDKEVLNILNRKHDSDRVFDIISFIKEEGIPNINIDLIYGVTNDFEIVKNDINKFLKLNIPHISCYSLIIEDHTILGINNYKNIDEDIEYRMYNYIENKLLENGYIHYEVSNYCKENYQSIHNINYWQNGYYYGFGLGSVSYLDNYRISNTKNINKYISGNYILDSVFEDEFINMSNDMILGLRMLKGVNIVNFENKYHKNITDIFDIEDLLKKQILIIKNDHMYINKKYLYLSNQILIRFLDIKN